MLRDRRRAPVPSAAMLIDVLLHFGLEALGALGLRCALGFCEHIRHRVAVWIPFGLGTSWVTVSVLG
jgi:hypothetical protein